MDLRKELLEILAVEPGEADDDTDAALLDAVRELVPPTLTYLAPEAVYSLPQPGRDAARFVLRPMTHAEKRAFLARQDGLRRAATQLAAQQRLLAELEKRLEAGDDVDERLAACIDRVNRIDGVGLADTEAVMCETVAPLVLRVHDLVVDGAPVAWPSEREAQLDALTRLGSSALKALYDWTVSVRGGIDGRVRGN